MSSNYLAILLRLNSEIIGVLHYKSCCHEDTIEGPHEQ